MVDLSLVSDIVTILGVIFAFSYYVLTVQNTKRSREAQIFVQIMGRATDPRWLKGFEEVQAFNFNNYKDFERYIDENPENWDNVFYFYHIMDDLGGLVRGGFIGLEILAYTYMSPFVMGWEKIMPIIEDWRTSYGSNKLWDGVEYLHGELVKFTKKHPELAP